MRKRGIIIGCITVAAIALAGLGILGVTAAMKDKRVNYHEELFGENVYIFSPKDNASEVNELLEDIYTIQEIDQFGDRRYALMFLPGEYEDKIDINVGFYTQVAGLGLSPEDVSVNTLNSYAQWLGDDSNHNATCNFWRGVENMTVREDCTWAVSQATDMRRMNLMGNLYFHDNGGWASGGFNADTHVEMLNDSGSQQQWLSRNSSRGEWSGANWNLVFVGDAEGSTPDGTWPALPYTTIDETEMVREKPFLVYDKKEGYGVYMSALHKNYKGTSWENKTDKTPWVHNLEEEKAYWDGESDYIMSIDMFYVAKEGVDDAVSMNEAIASGKHLLVTPGIYKLEDTIHVTGQHRVVLGMGLASLVSENGKACMDVTDESGITVAGLLFDAGMVETDDLMVVGSEDNKTAKDMPISLSDLYFRVGGTRTPEPTKAKNCLRINADDVIGDNFWIWRADHGDQVAWDKNTCANGLIVKGDNVICYALMVEHFNEYQTVWEGNGGRVYMYQSEIPYDVPSQMVWMSRDGKRPGYASFFVDDNVTDFKAYGLGIYLYNRDQMIVLESAMEMPDHEGVRVENICTVMLNGNPGMKHIINEAGKSVAHISERRVLLNYENGVYE